MTNVPTRYAHTIFERADDLAAYISGEDAIRQAFDALRTRYQPEGGNHPSVEMQRATRAVTIWIGYYNALFSLGLLSGPYHDRKAYGQYLRQQFLAHDDMAEDDLMEFYAGYGPQQRLRDFLWCASRPDWVAGAGATALKRNNPEKWEEIMRKGPAPLDDLLDNFERDVPFVIDRIENETAVLIPADLRHLNDPRLVPWLDGILADQIVEFMMPREVKTAA